MLSSIPDSHLDQMWDDLPRRQVTRVVYRHERVDRPPGEYPSTAVAPGRFAAVGEPFCLYTSWDYETMAAEFARHLPAGVRSSHMFRRVSTIRLTAGIVDLTQQLPIRGLAAAMTDNDFTGCQRLANSARRHGGVEAFLTRSAAQSHGRNIVVLTPSSTTLTVLRSVVLLGDDLLSLTKDARGKVQQRMRDQVPGRAQGP